MIKTKDEILTQIKEKLADDTTDETLGLIEDITDTLSDFEAKTSDSTNWKEKYEQNDADWRKKYKERFFKSDGNNDGVEHDDDDEGVPKKPLRFEDLFTVKE